MLLNDTIHSARFVAKNNTYRVDNRNAQKAHPPPAPLSQTTEAKEIHRIFNEY